MIESPVVFGRYDNLVGVVSRPESTEDQPQIAAIFLTAGMLHNTGPFRLHVLMARELALHGIPSIRFCLSGIGESFGVGGNETSIERATLETQLAMDLLQEQLGVTQFLLFGLCSGADDSLYVALEDERVAGAVLMDGCGYRTKKYYFHEYCGRRLRQVIQPNFCSKLWRKVTGTATHVAATLTGGEDIREFPDQIRAERDIQSLVDRGARFLFLYTGGVPHYYNYAGQFFDMFPNLITRDRVEVLYLPEIDHVARLAEDRQRIVDESVAWMIRLARELQTPNRLNEADTVKMTQRDLELSGIC